MTTNNEERDYWNKERTRDNYRIRTMTDAQHRAVSLLALYTYKAYRNKEKIADYEDVFRRIYADFFIQAVPTMLHAAGLPDLGLTGRAFIDEDADCVIEKARKYLCYIDRKYGTWYAPLNYEYAA